MDNCLTFQSNPFSLNGKIFLIKSVRGVKKIYYNWKTKKMQKLKFAGRIISKEVTTNWSDLIAIYKIENDSLCKFTKLYHATLQSSSFEKQKVTLELNIFNEEAAAFLNLTCCNNATILVNTVATLWNCINVKSKAAWFKLK